MPISFIATSMERKPSPITSTFHSKVSEASTNPWMTLTTESLDLDVGVMPMMLFSWLCKSLDARKEKRKERDRGGGEGRKAQGQA